MDSTIKPEAPAQPVGGGILEFTAMLAIGGSVSTVAVVGLLRILTPLGNVWLEAGAAVFAFTGLFFATLALMERYTTSDWQVPTGTEGSDWALRRKVSLVLGVLAVVTAAAFASFYVKDHLARALHGLIAVIMSVSAANDFRRFRLPLPLTFAGIMASIALLTISPYSWLIVALAFGWAMLMIVISVFVAKSGLALGDMIALFWIALASPFNGLIAVFFGQLTLDILARIVGWKAAKTRVPIGGAWLIAAAFCLAMPQWPALLATSQAAAPVFADAPERGARFSDAEFETGKYTEAGLRELALITHEAGYLTGRISFENDRATRIQKSREAAARVRELGRFAARASVPGSVRAPIARSLNELATSLSQYDVDGVRNVSGQLAEQRESVQALFDEFKEWKARAETNTPTQTIESAGEWAAPLSPKR